jgi:hypothetical protein
VSNGVRARGFSIACEGAGDLVCAEVRGFRDALRAARDPRAPLPKRLVVVAPDDAASSWLETFAEDSSCVRRRIVVSRLFDGVEVQAVVTIAAHGFGIDTSLAVESLRAPETDDIFRSGVHRKIDLEAALARY